MPPDGMPAPTVSLFYVDDESGLLETGEYGKGAKFEITIPKRT